MAMFGLIDVNYLCHRAMHTTGMLEFMGNPTGVAFGVIRDIQAWTELFRFKNLILAFDHPNKSAQLRRKILPTYKSSRQKGLKPEDLEQLESLHKQMERMQNEIFPKLGYRNIFSIEGYEADDIIAESANTLPEGDEGIIISSDADLFQCLSPSISIYHPARKVMITSESFMQEWKIDPLQWVDVKCLAGCSTDDIPGIDGIGEKSAAGWFNGSLKPGGKKYAAISQNIHLISQNKPLVRLPFPGIRLPVFRDDEVTEESKIQVQEELGIRPRRAHGTPVENKGELKGGFFK